jgi:hypothetical protein
MEIMLYIHQAIAWMQENGEAGDSTGLETTFAPHLAHLTFQRAATNHDLLKSQQVDLGWDSLVFFHAKQG